MTLNEVGSLKFSKISLSDHGVHLQILQTPRIQGLTLGALDIWTQNHPQVMCTCPGYYPQRIAQNRYSKSFGPEPLPLMHRQYFDSVDGATQ